MSRQRKSRAAIITAGLIVFLGGSVAALEPVLVKNLDFGPGSSTPCEFVTVNGVQLFAATDSRGRELWKTDGTYLGTSRVKDIRPFGTSSSNPQGFLVFDSPILGEIALFNANDGTTGNELWRTDGTEAGTQRVANLNSGAGNSNPSNLTYVAAQGKVYFSAFNGTSSGLYQTDGVNTSLVNTISLSSGLGSIATLGGNLFVSAVDGTRNTIELFKIELPGGSPEVVAYLSDDGSGPDTMTPIGGLLYLVAYTPTEGREPYVTDGTIGNLVALGDFKPGPQNGGAGSFTPFAGWVYFSSGAGLVRSQGTAATTSVVFPALSACGPLIDTGSLLYAPIFVNGVGCEPHVTDGTTVSLVEDVWPGASSSLSFPWWGAAIDGKLVFQANDGVRGVEPWESTDGTPAGTDILADMEPGATSSQAQCFRDFGAYGLMGAVQTPFGNELFALVETAHDFGDAPDSYGTAIADDGARHALGSGLYLGALVDAELDRPYDLGALADDSEGFDDEDGVTFVLAAVGAPLLGLGESVLMRVVASAGGKLDAWIDFNADGDFLDAGEKVTFTDPGGEDVAAGLNSKSFLVPATATPGASYLRVRLSSAGTASPIGLQPDGEVEDYRVTLAALDFGDAPDAGYATLRASNGARHGIVQGPRLGSSIDADSEGQPSADATGDDADGGDDEDGVTLPPLAPGQVVTVAVDVSDSFAPGDERGGGNPGLLNAWIDYNLDGDWNDPGEQVFQDQGLNFGTNMLPLAVPAAATPGTTLTRFRISTDGGLFSAGLAADGEVEDHQALIGVVEADLGITKTDGQDSAVPGEPVVYTIVASNPSGPSAAPGSHVSDSLPGELTGCIIECVAAGGASCGEDSEGRRRRAELLGGGIDQNVDLPVGGSVTFTVTCTVDPSAAGTLTNSATVSVPAGMSDPDLGNNSATDVDALLPEGDLAISKTDGVPWVIPPATLTYTILADNPGPSDAFGATVTDAFPLEVTNVTWTCVGSAGGACAPGGSGDISESVDLPAGGAVTFTALADVAAAPPEVIENTATVAAPGGFSDPDGTNNSATDVTNVVDGTAIFMDGFESGDTSAWSASTGEGAGALILDPGADSLDVALLLDPRSLERTGREVARVASGQSRHEQSIFRLDVETRGGRFKLVPSLVDSAGDWVVGRAAWLEKIPARIQLSWRRSLPGAEDGSLYLHEGDSLLGWVDGVATTGEALQVLRTHLARGRRLVLSIPHSQWRPDGDEGSPR